MWPRDATLTAFALLAAHQLIDARHILAHLTATQRRDGRWPQNYFPSGEPFWIGVQLDEAAFPVLLAAKLRELGDAELPGTAQMVRAAVGFIARTGPSSAQDRWEENPGVSPFTLAVAISALVAAAPWLTDDERDYALERWPMTGTSGSSSGATCAIHQLARSIGVRGYYVRIGSSEQLRRAQPARCSCVIAHGEAIVASALVSLDFSYLVRLGLRSAHDPRVQDTIKVVDQVLRVMTPSGALYHRYNEDGYGEYAGRPAVRRQRHRPRLAAAGRRARPSGAAGGEDPLSYLRDHVELREHRRACCPSRCGIRRADPGARTRARPTLGQRDAAAVVACRVPEAADRARAAAGRSSCCRRSSSATRGTVRGARGRRPGTGAHEVPVLRLEAGRALRIEDREPFTLHFGFDGWQRIEDRAASAQPFGLWAVRAVGRGAAPARVSSISRAATSIAGRASIIGSLLGHAGQERALGLHG